MSLELTGTIYHIGNTEIVGSAGTFKKRQLVVETDEQYKQKVPIDFVQDKCEILDKYKVGQKVTIGINIRGNEYNGKFYSSIQGWKINAMEGAQPVQVAQPAPVAEEPSDLPY
jgi:hypothetical protein